MSRAIVASRHEIDGRLSHQEKIFDSVDDALSYAESLKCVTVKVLEEDKGLVLYNKPGIVETTE
jgi:hypothetical protein